MVRPDEDVIRALWHELLNDRQYPLTTPDKVLEAGVVATENRLRGQLPRIVEVEKRLMGRVVRKHHRGHLDHTGSPPEIHARPHAH